nr:lysophospholipid acyltransferase family protein [Cognatiyoonia koreensis]
MAKPTGKAHVLNRGALTYANTFESPIKRGIVHVIEWLTGKVTIINLVRRFEKGGPYEGSAFWVAALRIMGIEITTPESQLNNIPKEGPVILVANHPHGMVDGMVLAGLIAKRREDYKILTRSLLTNIDTVASNYLIPVPFPHQSDAQKQFVEMRKQAMAALADGGLIALFPSGVVASSDTMFGPAIEREWNVFTAKMIRTSGATVVPCYFPGSNSRWYQMANRISATLRQSLLLFEIVHARNKPQAPIVGEPLTPDDMTERLKDPRAFMVWIRDLTLSLKD